MLKEILVLKKLSLTCPKIQEERVNIFVTFLSALFGPSKMIMILRDAFN